MPFEGCGLPGVFRGGLSLPQAADEVEEEEKLSRGEEDGSVGDEVIKRYGAGQERSGRTEGTARAGDAGELGVVAWFASQAGQVHGEKDRVGSDEGGPEMEAAEGFGHQAARARARRGDEGKPVVGRRVEAEDAGHCHDEMKVGDDEEGVVEVFV